MQVSSHADVPNTSGGQLVTTVGINGGHATASTLLANTAKPSISFENVDPSNLDDDDSDSDGVDGLAHVQQQLHINQTLQNIPNALSGPKPGKKTKGRVKIKMEFIENKLRRYTTFSKRKTGIMKKAYELSTLTGTQVMLLVASETGHVYTFATRKLQPMITSESGKALIQTCLNSPDPPPFSPGQQQAVEQRMNPSGFEETELTCAVGEEDSKAGIQMIPDGLGKPMFQMQGMVSAETSLQTSQASVMSAQQSVASTAASTAPTVAASYIQQHVTSGSTASATPAIQTTKGTTSPAAASNISMQLPAGLIFQSGTPITIPIQQGTSGGTSQQQTVYRLPSNQIVSVAGGQFATSTTEASPPTVSSASSSSTPSNITMVPDGLLSGSTASVGGGALTPGIVMYHTPQGVVYATPTATLNDRTIFNFQQPATAISVPQQDQQVGSGGQQIITIPVPVSVAANSGQVFHLAAAAPESGTVEVAQPPVKKSRK